jgi:hypothetical protein
MLSSNPLFSSVLFTNFLNTIRPIKFIFN